MDRRNVYFPEMSPEDLLYSTPVAVSGVAVIQVPYFMFPTGTFVGMLQSKRHISFARVIGVFIECARLYGGIIAFERIVGSDLRSCETPCGIRVFFISERAITEDMSNKFAAALYGDEEADDEPPSKSARTSSRATPGPPRPPWDFHNATLGDFQCAASMNNFGGDGGACEFVPHNGISHADGGEAQAGGGCGIFHSFDIVTTIDASSGAQAARAKTWGLGRPTPNAIEVAARVFADHVIAQPSAFLSLDDCNRFLTTDDRVKGVLASVPVAIKIAERLCVNRTITRCRRGHDHGVSASVRTDCDDDEVPFFDVTDSGSYVTVVEETQTVQWDLTRTPAAIAHAKSNIYYLSFSETVGLANASWFPGTEAMFKSCMLPWERAGKREMKPWIKSNLMATGNTLGDVDEMDEDMLRQIVNSGKPWAMGTPVELPFDSRPMVDPQDHMLYPNTDFLRYSISSRIAKTKSAVKAGLATPDELDTQFQVSLETVEALVSMEHLPGYTPMWHKVYAEYHKLFDEIRDALDAREIGDNTEFGCARMVRYRQIAYTPCAQLKQLHVSCGDLYLLGNQTWANDGMSMGQVRMIAVFVLPAGRNYRIGYDEDGRIDLTAGSAGGGKSVAMRSAAEYMAESSVKFFDFVTKEALKYDTKMSHDLMNLFKDEAPVGDRPQDIETINNFEVMCTKGWINTNITNFGPQVTAEGDILSMGHSVDQLVATRVTLGMNCNSTVKDTSGDIQRGAFVDRAHIGYMTGCTIRRPVNPEGKAYIDTCKHVSRLNHAAVGLLFGVAPQYGLPVPYKLDTTLVQVFRVLARNTRRFRGVCERNRGWGSFEAMCDAIAKRRLVGDWLFPGRNSSRAAAFCTQLRNSKRFKLRSVFSTKCFKYARVHGYVKPVEVVLAAIFFRDPTFSYSEFISLLLSAVQISDKDAEVDMVTEKDNGSPLDINYAKLTFVTTPDLKFPAKLVAEATARKIPSFSLDTIRTRLLTEKVGGESIVRPCSGASGTTSMLLHRSVLERGAEYATDGQIAMLTQLYGMDVYYDFDCQETMYILAGDVKAFALAPEDASEPFNRAHELAKMRMWKTRKGDPCIWTTEPDSHVSLTAEIAVKVPAGTVAHGSKQANSDGPLASEDGSPVTIKKKTVVGAMGIHPDFWKAIPAICRKDYNDSDSEQKEWDQMVCNYLSICGAIDYSTPGGDTILTGFDDRRVDLAMQEVFTLLKVPQQATSVVITNPDYVAPGGSMFASPKANARKGGMGRIFDSSTQKVRLTENSKLEAVLAASLRKTEEDMYRMDCAGDNKFYDTESDYSDGDD